MGISLPKLLIILAIVILFFGTKRLKNVGSDLGAAIKGFRAAIKDAEEADTEVKPDSASADPKPKPHDKA